MNDNKEIIYKKFENLDENVSEINSKNNYSYAFTTLMSLSYHQLQQTNRTKKLLIDISDYILSMDKQNQLKEAYDLLFTNLIHQLYNSKSKTYKKTKSYLLYKLLTNNPYSYIYTYVDILMKNNEMIVLLKLTICFLMIIKKKELFDLYKQLIPLYISFITTKLSKGYTATNLSYYIYKFIDITLQLCFTTYEYIDKAICQHIPSYILWLATYNDADQYDSYQVLKQLNNQQLYQYLDTITDDYKALYYLYIIPYIKPTKSFDQVELAQYFQLWSNLFYSNSFISKQLMIHIMIFILLHGKKSMTISLSLLKDIYQVQIDHQLFIALLQVIEKDTVDQFYTQVVDGILNNSYEEEFIHLLIEHFYMVKPFYFLKNFFILFSKKKKKKKKNFFFFF